jgi:hypothetical protein
VQVSTVTVGLTPLAQQYLDQTRPWVRFMSIMTFASAGLMLLAALMMLLVGVFGVASRGRRVQNLAGSAAGGLLRAPDPRDDLQDEALLHLAVVARVVDVGRAPAGTRGAGQPT